MPEFDFQRFFPHRWLKVLRKMLERKTNTLSPVSTVWCENYDQTNKRVQQKYCNMQIKFSKKLNLVFDELRVWIHTLWIVTFIIFCGPSHPTHFIQSTVLVLRESECASLSPLAFSAKRKRVLSYMCFSMLLHFVQIIPSSRAYVLIISTHLWKRSYDGTVGVFGRIEFAECDEYAKNTGC